MIKKVLILNNKETSVLAKKTYGERIMTSKPKEHCLLCTRSYGKEVNAHGIICGKKSAVKDK